MKIKRILKAIVLSPVFFIGGVLLIIGVGALKSGEWLLSKIGAI